MPVYYVFTQTGKDKREDVAKKIGDISAEGVKVLESKPIDGVYDLVPGGLRLQYPIYTTAAKIAMRHDVKVSELRTLLRKMGVTDPLILVEYEEIIPLSHVGAGARSYE